ncbi:MAG TPA: flagellar hook protein FlgE [Thiobacillaceae bacterium]|nr:flagellar hook protein FlgE [Thiobacillaceae bacterium]HNA81694.1 flagellar hook protein FlgE [Thiobacillaceae bacterium]HNF87935.1 flagellar hook protein FlgE [Thiobacillaceae bacterium]
MSFQQGLSGLSGASSYLDAIGNNIANTSTVGFKTGVTQFADVYATSLYGSGSLQIGIGTKVADVVQQFTQGNISVTNNPLDLAISGEGFFRMSKDGVISYTRDGQFHLDKDGYIVNSATQRLTGFLADSSGNIIGGAPSDLLISLAPSPPKVTESASLVANLNSSDAAIAGAIDPTDTDTYNWSTSFTIFDEAGNDHGFVLYFQKTASNSWDVDAYVNGTQVDMDPGTASNTGTIDFTTGGLVNQINGAAGAAVAVTVPSATLGTGAATMTFNLDLTDFTQYGTSSGVSTLTQDGYTSGRIASVSVDKEGLILGSYTNGQTQTLGQVVTYSFRNPQGLQAIGNNQYYETSDSGQPVSGTPGSGVLGNLQSGAVEESNVDLTAELVNLIVAQRMYQANAQTIKTQDQILQTLVNLR